MQVARLTNSLTSYIPSSTLSHFNFAFASLNNMITTRLPSVQPIHPHWPYQEATRQGILPYRHTPTPQEKTPVPLPCVALFREQIGGSPSAVNSVHILRRKFAFLGRCSRKISCESSLLGVLSYACGACACECGKIGYETRPSYFRELADSTGSARRQPPPVSAVF